MIPLNHANLIELLHIEALPLEERIMLVEDTTDLVEARTIARIAGMLSPTEQRSLVELMDAHDDDAVDALLDRRNVDIFAIAKEETDKVKQELFGVAQAALVE